MAYASLLPHLICSCDGIESKEGFSSLPSSFSPSSLPFWSFLSLFLSFYFYSSSFHPPSSPNLLDPLPLFFSPPSLLFVPLLSPPPFLLFISPLPPFRTTSSSMVDQEGHVRFSFSKIHLTPLIRADGSPGSQK